MTSNEWLVTRKTYMKTKNKPFQNLLVWQKAHQLILAIYQTTKKFPKEETFALTDQIKRASISITSNIAEGYSRSSTKEKIQFFYIALSSLREVENQLIIAKDLKYLTFQEYNNLQELTETTGKLLYKFIKSYEK